MSRLKNIELRSEEVKDILTSVPHWMIRYGNSIIIIIIISIIMFSWIVKYPDIVHTNVIITTDFPPEKIVAKTPGKIEYIFVYDKQNIKKGTILASIENPAKYEDVFFLKKILKALDLNQIDVFFPIHELETLELGEVETAYANFEKSYIDYQINKDLKPYMIDKQAQVFEQLQQQERLDLIIKQEQIVQKGLEIKKNDLDRHTKLFDKGAISKQEVELKYVEFLQQEKELNILQSQITAMRSSLIDLDKIKKSTILNENKDVLILRRNLILAYNQLKKSILDWELKYLLKSSISGRVTFLQIWKENQNIETGENVFVVVPEITSGINYIGKVKAKVLNSGKIKQGQEVNIRLDNYPDKEYGFIKGKVKSIALIPDQENNLLIDIELPEGILTTYNIKLNFQQEMSGRADIITEDLRLLQKVLYQFRDLFKR